MAVTDISTLQIKVESNGITQAANKLDKLAEKADKAEKAVKKLGTQVLASNTQIGGAAGQTVALTNAILLLNTNIGNLTSRTITQTNAQRHATDAMRDAHAAARGLTGSLGALWLTYGSVVPLMAGAAIGASFKQILTQGMELEHTLVNIRVKGQETIETMGKARQAVLDLGQGIYGPQQVAGALETMVLAGLKAEDAIAGLRPALNLATVGGTSIEKAAYTLVQVGTAMGYTSDSFGLVGDKIAKTAAVSMSSVESLSEAFKSASSVGVVYGVTLNDLGTQLAALSNLGIQGTAAGTAVKNFYKELDSDTKKVTGTLKKLGVDVNSLKIGDKFKDINSIMEILSGALDKAGDKGGKAMQALSNERGMRNFAALLQLYRKGIDETGESLQDLTDKIANSAGYTAVAAAQIALTSKNQVQSTLNTLKTSFVDTFTEMQPQVNVFAHELKKIFASGEFKNGLKEVATSLGNFFVELVKAVPTLIEVGKAFLVFKAGMIAAAATTAVVTGIRSVSTALIGLQAVMAGTATASATMAAMFPPLAFVLGVAAAAWWLYNKNKDDALDTTKLEAAQTMNSELITHLEKEAERLEVANKHLAENNTLKQAAAKTSRELALAEMGARNATAEADAKKQLDAKFAGLESDPNRDKLIRAAAGGNYAKTGLKQYDEYLQAHKNWKAAQKESIDSVDKFEKTFQRMQAASERNQTLTDQRLEKEAKAAAERASLMAGLAGNPDITAPEEPKRNAHAEKIKGEALELDRLTASYLAKAEATDLMAESGVMHMARTRQAIVETNDKQLGYYTAEEKRMMMEKARAADEAKFAQQKANTISDATSKVHEIINRGIAQRAAETIEGYKSMGMMEKLMAATAAKTSLTKEETEAMKAKGREADKQLHLEAALAKLTTATGSSQQRAQGLIDEADAMMEYGKAGKQTALQLAAAQIEKLKFADGTAATEIALRNEAAALEDIAKAYNNLARLNSDLNQKEAAEAAIGAEGVIGAETAKVVAYERATKAIIDSSILRAQVALEVAKAGKNPEAVKEAQATFDKMVAVGKKASETLKKQFEIKIKVAGLKDIGNSFSEMSKSIRSFGEHMNRVGEGFDGLAGGFNRLAEIREKQGISEQERLQGQLGAYGDLAAGASNFFSENSRGYQTMMAVSKVYHTAEMAMAMVRMGRLAVEAILTQGKGDPYSAFARMASMAAIVGALGFATGSFGKSGSGGKKAEDVQKTQGAGSVFGASEAKSESITRSIESLAKHSSVMLPVNQAMLASLRNIEASMSGLTNLVVRTVGVTDGSNMGIQTGKIGSGNGMNFLQNTLMGTNAVGGGISGAGIGLLLGGPVGAAIGAILGAVVGKTLGKLWGGTTQNIVDSGLQFGGKVSDLQSGSGFNQYASVDTTKKSWFGLKKATSNNVQTQGLGAELSSQFGLIFSNLEDALKVAAPALGKSGQEVSNAINNMVLETTSVSLKDLKGEELQQAINGVVSKAMDQIAEQAFPAMGDFRRVGEGYAETVLRVAGGVEQAQVAMEQFGIKSVDLTAVLNKQGDVALEIAKQSIASVEGLNGVNAMLQGMGGSLSELTDMYKSLIEVRKQMNGVGLQGDKLNLNVIKGAGGVSELGSALAQYQDAYFTDAEKSAIMLQSVGKEFKNLGFALPASKAALRDLITSTSAIGTESSDKLTGKLLVLSEAYAKATEAAEKEREEKIDGIKSIIDSLKDFAKSIREFRDSLLLGDLSTLTPEQKYAEAKAQYDSTLVKAMAGDAAARENITGIAQALLEASRVINASDDAYGATFSKVLRDMDSLEAIAGSQITDAQRQLDALNAQVAGINTLNTTAEGILSALVAPPPVVNNPDSNGDVVAELKAMREEMAAAKAAHEKQISDLIAATYDSQDRAADKIVEGSVASAREAAWANKNMEINDR